eukprot:2076402-Rhodomonas_salina.2
MADAEPQEYLVDGKPVFDDEGNRIPSKGRFLGRLKKGKGAALGMLTVAMWGWYRCAQEVLGEKGERRQESRAQG